VKENVRIERALFVLLSLILGVLFSLSIFVNPMYSMPNDKELCNAVYTCERLGQPCRDGGQCSCTYFGFCIVNN